MALGMVLDKGTAAVAVADKGTAAVADKGTDLGKGRGMAPDMGNHKEL
jgi:hypothetical protein